jgi:MoaA/NifB/PqqE/SkfB family radical SAM enzyme
MFTYLRNLLRLRRGDFTLLPRLAVYYVTMQCNLNCTYCEDFGARRNRQVISAPPLEDAKRILAVIRTGMDRLWLTGGEPLLHPQMLELLAYVRNDLKFRQISLITNGTLLSQNLSLLPFLDRLIVSLDAIDPQALSAVSVPHEYVDTVIENVRVAAFLQKAHGFRLIVNAVITPETLPAMDRLLSFCTENEIQISFSPQSVNNLVRYELVVSPDYQAFIHRIIALKKEGAPVFGSFAYYRILLDQTPYECFPTLVPRVLPDGWLAYPCRPMEKVGGEQGGRPVNLRDVHTWEEAWQIAAKTYGDTPTACVSCFQQCYMEPSLMQAHPREYLREWLHGNDVSAYAPG